MTPRSDVSEPVRSAKDFLRGLTLMKGAARETLDGLSRRASSRVFHRDALVWLEGQPIDRVSFVVSGRLNLFKPTSDVSQQILYLVDVGELASFDPLSGESHHRQSAISAADDTVILTIAMSHWRRRVNGDPSLRRNIAEACMEHHLRLLDRIVELTAGDVEHRLATLVLRLACVPRACVDPARAVTHRPLRPVCRTDLARLLGVQYETVSRQLNAWRRDGRVVLDGSTIRVVDGDWLEELAGEVPHTWRGHGNLAERRAAPRCTESCEACPAFAARAAQFESDRT